MVACGVGVRSRGVESCWCWRKVARMKQRCQGKMLRENRMGVWVVKVASSLRGKGIK